MSNGGRRGAACGLTIEKISRDDNGCIASSNADRPFVMRLMYVSRPARVAAAGYMPSTAARSTNATNSLSLSLACKCRTI